MGIGGLLATTRLKLLAAVPPGMRGVATRAEERFHLDPGGWAHARPRPTEHLQTVARAVWEDRMVRLRYLPGGRADVVRRTVHPLGLVHKAGTWYLVASHRQAPRVYRVDRVRSATQLDRPAQRPEGFDLPTFWSAWEQEYAGRLRLAVDVRLGPAAQRHRDGLGALAPREVAGECEQGDGWIRQTLVFDSTGVARAALPALAPDIEVLAPDEVRADLRRAADAVADRHRSGPRG